MTITHAQHRMEQAHAASRRASAPRAGESMISYAARLRSPEMLAQARRHADRLTRIARRCQRIAAEARQ